MKKIGRAIVLLLAVLTTAPNAAVARFSSPEQKTAVLSLLETHREWMLVLDSFFCNPFGEANNVSREVAETQRRLRGDSLAGAEQHRKEFESFFGREYYDAFLAYHQNMLEAEIQFINREFDGVKAFLLKAKKNAELLKRMPLVNPGLISPLFADKMLVDALLFLGMTEYGLKKQKAGKAYFQSASQEVRRMRWHWGEAQTLYYMAVAEEWAGLPDAAKLYEAALAIARDYRVHDYIARICEKLALIYLQERHLEASAILLEEAIISIEFMRTKLEEEGRKVNFMGNHYPVYRFLAGLQIELGKQGRALEVLETAKSRVLQELLQSPEHLAWAGAGHDILLTQEQILAEVMEDLENLKGEEYEAQAAMSKQRHDEIVAEIRKTNPDFGMLKIGNTAGLADIQALLDGETALLAYNYMDMQGNLFSWLVTKDSVALKKIPLDSQALTGKVQALRMLMGKPKTPAVHKVLGQMYELIIQPWEKGIRGKRLIIVPDAALHSVPFAALMDAQGKFMIQSHAIWLAPSLNVLKLCMDKEKRPAKTILAFGNPDLTDAKMDLPNAQIEVQGIVEHFPGPVPVPGLVLRSDAKADLPQAQTEVKAIAEKFPQAQAYFRKAATETRAKEIIGAFDVLHFACHGEMVLGGNAMDSCLRLAPDASNDGKLTAAEIFDLKLKAQLVILSGCETGRGEICPGDEMLGLTRGFFSAGVPSLIVSLWKVDDNATAVLMQHFYENLGKMGKAEALRAAQIATMKEKRHPYFWASFYLVGDGK